jgi:hypothetical protein
MKIDPNSAVGQQSVCVMCRGGAVELPDGTSSPAAGLDSPEGPFQRFCKGLDPNLTYISAFLPYRDDEEVFYKARAVAQALGIHMQATVERADLQLAWWREYRVGYKS